MFGFEIDVQVLTSNMYREPGMLVEIIELR